MSRLNSREPGLTGLGVPVEGGELFELALTHRSFAAERPEADGHNERLEFLGDAVLDLVVTDLIYRAYPDVAEGDLARLRASLVNQHALAELARTLGLGLHMRLGKGEEASGGRDKDSLLANTFEAVVGAVYLERGVDAVAGVLGALFSALLVDADTTGFTYDAKTILQEVAVREKGARPVYRIASSGPDHDKSFIASVYIDTDVYGEGAGKSKKEAEQNAAREALLKLQSADAPREKRDADARAS